MHTKFTGRGFLQGVFQCSGKHAHINKSSPPSFLRSLRRVFSSLNFQVHRSLTASHQRWSGIPAIYWSSIFATRWGMNDFRLIFIWNYFSCAKHSPQHRNEINELLARSNHNPYADALKHILVLSKRFIQILVPFIIIFYPPAKVLMKNLQFVTKILYKLRILKYPVWRPV